MKTTSIMLQAYETPECKVIVIDSMNLICQSLNGLENEHYQDGDTSGWFNN